jgi:hypothetical protein
LRRPIRIALWSVGVAGGLLVTASLAAPFLIRADRFLPLLEERASRALGAPVEIGWLRLRPGLGIRLEAGDIRLGTKGAAAPLQVETLRVGLRLLPLLRGEARLSAVAAEGVRVRLRRQADGGWVPAEKLGSLEGGGAAEPGGGRGAAAAPALPVDRIDLRQMFVTFTDPRGPAWLRQGWTVGPARMELEPGGGRSPWSFDLGLALGDKQEEILMASGSAAPADLAGASARLKLEGIEYSAASRLAALAGVTLPAGVRSGSLGGVLDLKDGVARLDPLRIRLGEDEIEGKLEFSTAASELNGELTSRSLNLDAILVALSTPTAAPAPPASKSSARSSGGAGAAPPLHGALRIGIERGRVLGLAFEQARIEAALEQGRLALRSLKVSLYGGDLEGSGSLGIGRAPLPYSLKGEARDVDLEGALPALRPDLKGVVTGHFTGSLDLQGAGLTGAALTESLKGPMKLDLRDGRIASISVLRQVAVLLEVAGGKGIGRDHTPYQTVTGDFLVEKGRARTRNLALRSEDLDLDGEGSLGLDATLDFAVDGRFSPPVSKSLVDKTPSLRHLMEKDGRLRLRLLMKGALAAPRVEIDQAFLRKALKRAAEERGREKIRDRLQDLLR